MLKVKGCVQRMVGQAAVGRKSALRTVYLPLSVTALLVLLLGGCGIFGAIFMPTAEDADIQAGFEVLGKAYAYAQEGHTIVSTIPSETSYSSADGTVTLTVELKASDSSPHAVETNTYTISNFKDPDSEIVITNASIVVINTKDSWGDTAKSEDGYADFGTAQTLQRLDFELYGKYPAWGLGINYDFGSGGLLKANYKDVGYLRVPMIP